MKLVNDLIASYTYDNVGNRITLGYGNGSSEAFAYEEDDPRYRLAIIDYAYKCDINANVESHGGLKFTRDNSGNPLTWGDKDNKYTKSYEYDNNSRLKSANYPGHPTESWNYDWVGNRNNTGYIYNAADMLTDSPNPTKHYTYDDAGNLEHITVNGVKDFTYTYNNLVSSILHNGGPSSSMVWDASGNRVSFTSSTGGTYNYLYDTTAGIPAVIEEVLPNSNSIYYVREPSGALIARISGGLQEGTIQYYHFDELGSTLFMTDSAAVVTDRYTYDAWGNVSSHTGTTSQPYQYVGEQGYYTHYQDSNLPFIQTGVRFYNPEIGRYMQVDSVENAGISSYTYANGMVTVSMDPSGKSSIEIIAYQDFIIVPHRSICIDGECWGFYPVNEYLLFLMCTCRSTNHDGAMNMTIDEKKSSAFCCMEGEVRKEGKKPKQAKVLQTIKSSKKQDDMLKKWINNWSHQSHMYCLTGNSSGKSDNCWTFAQKGYDYANSID